MGNIKYEILTITSCFSGIVSKNQRKVWRAGNPVRKYPWGRPLIKPGHAALGVIAFFGDEFSLLTFFCGQKKVRIK